METKKTSQSALSWHSFINLEKTVWQWAALLTMALIWGTSFILIKKGLQSYTYTQVAAFRLFFSFVFSIPFIIKHIKKLKLSNLKSLLIVSVVGAAIPAFLFSKSQTQINSSLAGMLNSLTPLFTLIIGVTFYRSKVKRNNILGVFLGLLGAAGLIFKGKTGIFDEINLYALFVVIATVCYGTSTNEVRHHLPGMGGIAITSLTFLLVGPFAGIYLLFSDYSPAMASEHYIINLGFIAILALFSSVLALMMFNSLIKYTSALFAASVTYIIPIFAIIWGIIDGESISVYQLLWILLIFLGVYMVNKK